MQIIIYCQQDILNCKCQRPSEHLLLVIFFHRDGDLLDLVDGEVGGGAERSDDGLRVETLLHIRLQLLQELSSQESDGGGAIPDLSTGPREKKVI